MTPPESPPAAHRKDCPVVAARAVHACLCVAELADCLDRHLVDCGRRGYSILFRDPHRGTFSVYLSGGGATSVPEGATESLTRFLAGNDGRLVPVPDGLALGAGPAPRAACTLSFRDEGFGLFVLHGPDESDPSVWQPVADALATELVKLQLYEAANHESQTAGTKLAALNESGELVKYVDLEVLLTKLMELSIRIMSAQVGAILLVERGALRTGVEWGLSEDFLLSLRGADGCPFLEGVLDGGEPVLIQDARTGERLDTRGLERRLSGLIAIPLVTQGKKLGLIVIVNPESEAFDESGFDVLSTIANLSAATVENAILYRKALEHERIEAEMQLASTVQGSLLPESAPRRKGIELTGWNLPCTETGGDYFDFIDVGAGRTAIVIGDATGHGMGAALMMFIVRSTLRALLTQKDDLVEILETMNDLVEADSETDRFMTLFVGIVDANAEKIVYASAGHDPPIVHRLQRKQLLELGGTGIPLGALPGSRYRTVEAELQPGDLWVFGTDGIWEARDPHGEFYGKGRLITLVRECAGLPLEDASRRIRDDILAYHAGAPQQDDITAVLMRVE